MAVNIGSLGRHKGISRSGLSTVLQELKDKEFPSATSRQTIKRRRDDVVDLDTRYGRILQSWRTTLLPVEQKKTKKTGSATKPKSEKTVDFPFVQPIPLLSHMCMECTEFSGFMLKVLDQHRPSQENPLNLIAYSDAISPGNVLAHNQGRKVECIYWSIKEFGDLALTLEKNWFLLGIARCDYVRRLPGKMSQYFKEACERFFSPLDMRHGVQLAFPDGTRVMLFCELSIVVGDEVALKEAMEFKGASGSLLCPICRNVVDWKSELHLHSTEFVPSNRVTLNGVDLHSDKTLLDTVKYLADCSRDDRITPSAFKKLQQSLGYNHSPDGFLGSSILTLRPISSIMCDWMHTYSVSGLWNVECGALVARLSASGVTQETLNAELHRFTWPKAYAGKNTSGIGIFEKQDQDGDIKCSASECLSIYSVIRFVLKEMDLPGLREECASYFRLCRVLDLLVHQKKHGWDAAALQEAIENHLRGYVALYERFLPKHHYSLHLPSQCTQHGTLVSCWVHERKHKFIKRHANLICNTWGQFERSVIVDAMGDMLADLTGSAHEPYYGGLCSPSPAPASACRELSKIGFDGPMLVARSAYYAPGSRAWAGDVVALVDDMGDRQHGQVNFFAKCGDCNLCCVTHWVAQGGNKFRKGPDSFVADLSYIVDVCIHCDADPGMAKIVPCTTWL